MAKGKKRAAPVEGDEEPDVYDWDTLRFLNRTIREYLDSRATKAERQAAYIRGRIRRMRRRLAQLNDQADEARAERRRQDAVLPTTKRRTVTLYVWMRYRTDNGDFTRDAPSPKCRGVRNIRRDGDGYVYICKKDNLLANVDVARLGGAELGTLYWNDNAYATFSDAEHDHEKSLSDIRGITEEPSIAAFLERMESASFLALEIKSMGPPMSAEDGDALEERLNQEFGNSARLYRDSPYAALDVSALADALEKDAPPQPRRCGPELLIRKYGDAIARNAASRGRSSVFTPTFQWFWEFFKRPGTYVDGSDFLMTPLELRAFCESFRIPLTVIDGLSRAVPGACYNPSKEGTSNYARLCAQIVDRHLYDLNHRTVSLYLRARARLLSWVPGDSDDDDEASIDSLDDDTDEDQLAEPGGDSILFGRDDPAEPMWLDDVPSELPRMQWDTLPAGDVHIATDQCVDDILNAFSAAGIVPSIGMVGARVTRVSLRVRHAGKTKEITRRVHICPPRAPRGELLPQTDGRYEVERTHLHRMTLRHIVQQQATASVYAGGQTGYDRDASGPQVAHIFREFPTAAVCDRFVDPTRESTATHFSAVDQSKAHTSVLAALAGELPVFYPSDRFVPYDGSAIDEHSFYMVRQLATAHAASLRRDAPLRLLVDRPDTLLRGANLLLAMTDAEWTDRFEITWVARPSRLVNVKASLHAALRDLYNDPAMSASSRKFVVNCLVGELGTKVSYKTSNFTFATYNEAATHAQALGLNAWSVKCVGDYFVVTQETRMPLRDGRLPIYLAVLQEVRRRNYLKAVELGLPIVAVKTDCLYLRGALPPSPGAAGIDDILRDGGAWRTEPVSLAVVGTVSLARGASTLADLVPHVQPVHVERITLTPAEEYDPAVLKRVFDAGPCYITSTVPGAGKSTAIVEYCVSTGEAFMIATPMNKLAADYRSRGFPATSLHAFLGLTVSDSKRGQGIAPVASGEYNEPLRFLIVDEIFTAPELLRVLLREWELRHPDVTVFRVGDVRQLPAIEYNVRHVSDDDDMARVEASMLADCSRMLTLRVCKRVTSDTDRALVHDLYTLFWEQPWRGRDTIAVVKHRLPAGRVLRRVDDIPSNAAVVSFHVATAEALAFSLAMRDKPPHAVHLGAIDRGTRQPLWVWPGAVLRCYSNTRLGRAVNASRLVNNGRYTVVGINVRKREVALVLDGDDEPVRVGWMGVCKWFGYGAHAATGHSWQGATIKDRPLVLTDLDSPFISRRWLWMSLTRGDDMTRVYLFEPSASERAANGFGGRTWAHFMRKRIAGYKAQDAAAGRTFNDAEYVDVDFWLSLMEACAACCGHCGQSCGLDADDQAATLDRKLRSVAHLKDNVQVACAACNRARH